MGLVCSEGTEIRGRAFSCLTPAGNICTNSSHFFIALCMSVKVMQVLIWGFKIHFNKWTNLQMQKP